MIGYIDSSALVKKYIGEPGSDRVENLFREVVSVLTSVLTELELVSFAERAKRESKIDSPEYRRIIAAFERDFQDGAISVLAIDHDVLRNARRLIRQRRLRVQDAIQLASALSANRLAGGEIVFICADRSLLEAARLEGLKCVGILGYDTRQQTGALSRFSARR